MAVKKRTVPLPPKAPKVASTRPPAAPKANMMVPAKNFRIESGEPPGYGKRILIHADSGMGKTTLTSLAPSPVFIGLDNGGIGIEDYHRVDGVESFLDVRSALQAPIYDEHATVTVDTVTLLEELGEQHVLSTIPLDSGGKATSLITYGWNNGYRHLYDTMKLILQDCDALIHKGKNVILIAQSTPHSVPNPGGEDFIRQGPRLVSRKNANIEALYCEWADHIFYIGYQFLSVDKKKKVSGDGKRAVFVHPEPHFRAKSRTLGLDKAVVSFDDPKDNSIWKFLFEEGG